MPCLPGERRSTVPRLTTIVCRVDLELAEVGTYSIFPAWRIEGEDWASIENAEATIKVLLLPTSPSEPSNDGDPPETTPTTIPPEVGLASRLQDAGVLVTDPLVCDEIRGGRLPVGYPLVVLAAGGVPDHNGANEAVVGTADAVRDVVRLGDQDVFCGDAGGDEANIMGGSPVVHGEDGDDEVRLLDNSNGGVFLGGPGTDRVRYSALTIGVETVFAGDGSGDTTWSGGTHRLDSVEWWAGTESADTVDAGRSPFRLSMFGLRGDDLITGTEFGDVIEGGAISGLGSLDHIRSTGSDTIDGGGGSGDAIIDFVNIVDGGISVTFAADGTATSVGPGNRNTTMSNFRQISATNFDDRLDATGPTQGVFLAGGEGNDVLIGGDNVDRLNGGPGTDNCTAGPKDTTETCE